MTGEVAQAEPPCSNIEVGASISELRAHQRMVLCSLDSLVAQCQGGRQGVKRKILVRAVCRRVDRLQSAQPVTQRRELDSSAREGTPLGNAKREQVLDVTLGLQRNNRKYEDTNGNAKME